jgi:hypothetical protein
MSSDTADIWIAWSHPVTEIPAGGLEVERTASQTQLQAIAAALDLLAVERLAVRYRIEPLPAGRYRLFGELEARIAQACVVTLDPIATDIIDELTVEFRSSAQLPETGNEEQEILAADEHEPIESDRLGVGRVVFETLAAAVPPYPRAEDAALERHEAGPATTGSSGPFAALAGWKPKRG